MWLSFEGSHPGDKSLREQNLLNAAKAAHNRVRQRGIREILFKVPGNLNDGSRWMCMNLFGGKRGQLKRESVSWVGIM